MQEQDYSQIAEQHDAADFECLDTEILLEWLTQRYKLKRPYVSGFRFCLVARSKKMFKEYVL